MGFPVYHIEVDKVTGHVASIHWGDSGLLEYRQTMTDRQVIPLIDAKLIEQIRLCPENFQVKDNQILPLPEDQKMCRRIHHIDLAHAEGPLEILARQQNELNETVKLQTDKIDEAVRINSRVAMAAEDLTPEVNQLRSSLEAAAVKFNESTQVLGLSTRSNSDAAKAVADQNAAMLGLLSGLREDIQALTTALRAK